MMETNPEIVELIWNDPNFDGKLITSGLFLGLCLYFFINSLRESPVGRDFANLHHMIFLPTVGIGIIFPNNPLDNGIICIYLQCLYSSVISKSSIPNSTSLSM